MPHPRPPGPPPTSPGPSYFISWNHSELDPHYDLPKQRNNFQAQITASINISYAASMTISLLVLILLKGRLPPAQTRIKVALILILGLFVGNTFLIWANASGGTFYLISNKLTYRTIQKGE